MRKHQSCTTERTLLFFSSFSPLFFIIIGSLHLLLVCFTFLRLFWRRRKRLPTWVVRNGRVFWFPPLSLLLLLLHSGFPPSPSSFFRRVEWKKNVVLKINRQRRRRRNVTARLWSRVESVRPTAATAASYGAVAAVICQCFNVFFFFIIICCLLCDDGADDCRLFTSNETAAEQQSTRKAAGTTLSQN